MLNNAAHNASNTSPGVQREILQVFAKKIRYFIREKIGDYKYFNIENICKLVDRYYPKDFSEQGTLHLRFQLEHFELDIH